MPSPLIRRPTDPADRIAVAPGRWSPKWLVLLLVCVGQFMVVLDISIVNVALPSIETDLHFSTTSLQWVVNAYTLSFAGFLLLGGRVADLLGRRRIFLFGLGLFTVASLVGGTAQDQAMLLGARALQGLGAAVLAPATLTILMTSFSEGAARARALGVWSAVASAGASAGALLGGILTDALSWRWILFVNVPIGLVALPLARRFLPESKADAAHRHLDVLGALTVTGGLVALVYAIVSSQGHSWLTARVTVPLVVSVVLLSGFLVVQAKVRACRLSLCEYSAHVRWPVATSSCCCFSVPCSGAGTSRPCTCSGCWVTAHCRQGSPSCPRPSSSPSAPR